MIERYLNKECAADESKSIEERMANDKAFADEVDWFKQFRSDMKERTSFGVLAEIEKMKREDQVRVKRKMQLLVGLLISAAIVLVMFLYPSSSVELVEPIVEKSPREEFRKRLPQWEEYLPYETGLQSLGEEDDAKLREAQQLIEAEQHLEALPLLAEYLENLSKDDDDYEMRLEYGKILLREQLDVEAAKAQFSEILQSPALPFFKEAATFYLGISHFLLGQQDSTRIVWQQILNDADHRYYQQVQEVLKAEPKK